MVANIIGNYLIQKGLISDEQFRDLLAEQQKVRVKLGLIAVAEGLLTQEETDKINKLQSAMDKRFGDIAVDKGYLTEGQVVTLLKKQGNAYLAFAQSLENQELMTIEQLEQYMIDFQQENGFTVSDIEDLKSDDVDRIMPLYVPEACDKYLDLAGIAVRTIIRCVDSDIFPDYAYLAESCEADNGALQYVEGNKNITCGMVADGTNLLPMASAFAKEKFEQINEDALDSIAELLNCINGLYATALSQGGIIVDLQPPRFSEKISCIKGNMLVLPLNIKGNKIQVIFGLESKIEMIEEGV